MFKHVVAALLHQEGFFFGEGVDKFIRWKSEISHCAGPIRKTTELQEQKFGKHERPENLGTFSTKHRV